MTRCIVAEIMAEAHLEVVEFPFFDLKNFGELILHVLAGSLVDEYQVIDLREVLLHAIEGQPSEHPKQLHEEVALILLDRVGESLDAFLNVVRFFGLLGFPLLQDALHSFLLEFGQRKDLLLHE